MDENKYHRRTGRLKAYASVFLLIVMASYTSAVLCIIDAASSYAGESIAENVCAVTGRSLLSEYQSELYKRYGIFLLRNSETVLEKKADIYLAGSLIGKRGVVRFKSAAANIDMALWPGTDIYELKRQIRKVSIGINEYILSNYSFCTKVLENTYEKYEVEKIVCGKESDEENIMSIKTKLTSLRFAINLATLNKEDIDISAIGTMIETVIPGNIDDAAVEVSQALEQAKRDADLLLSGGKVPLLPGKDGFSRYEDYLRLFLPLVPEDIKFGRMMYIMETNIRMVDKVIFSFSDYVYGFEMRTVLVQRTYSPFFSLKGSVINVWQHFSYL